MTDEEKKEYEEANLYLTHTGVDDFNLEKHQSENRIWAIKILLNLIEKQSKEIEELKKYEEGYKLLSYSLDNYTSNDKIKAKIEEVKDGTFDAKIVLQSLLEKE